MPAFNLGYTVRRMDNIPIGKTGCFFHRILYMVGRRTCCYIDVFPTGYRVVSGRPSDPHHPHSWSYPSDDLGIGKHAAIAKAVSICETTIKKKQSE